MPVPSRDLAVRTLTEGQARLDVLLAQLPERELTEPATVGGGDWSAKDLIGHIASWEGLALEALTDWRAGRSPRVEREIFNDPDGVDRFNAAAVAGFAARSPDDLRRDAERTHADLIGELEAIADDEWESKAPYPTGRRERLAELLGSILGAPKRPFGHAFAHLPDLEAYVRSVRGGGSAG